MYMGIYNQLANRFVLGVMLAVLIFAIPSGMVQATTVLETFESFNCGSRWVSDPAGPNTSYKRDCGDGWVAFAEDNVGGVGDTSTVTARTFYVKSVPATQFTNYYSPGSPNTSNAAVVSVHRGTLWLLKTYHVEPGKTIPAITGVFKVFESGTFSLGLVVLDGTVTENPSAATMLGSSILTSNPGNFSRTVSNITPVSDTITVGLQLYDAAGGLAGESLAIFDDMSVQEVLDGVTSPAPNKLGQEWFTAYDYSTDFDEAVDMVTDGSGNVYVTGRSENGTDYDIETLKYSGSGALLWSARYDGGSVDEPVGLALDSAGHVYVVGRSHNGTDYDFVAIKYDNNGDGGTDGFNDGDERWSSTFNNPGSNDEPAAMAVDGSDNVVLSGKSCAGANPCDALTVVFPTGGGGAAWSEIYDNAGADDEAVGVAVDGSGNVFITASTTTTSDDIVTLKYPAGGGTPLWTMPYDSGSNDTPIGVVVDVAGNVYVAGGKVGAGNRDFIVMRYRAVDGFREWLSGYDFGGQDLPTALKLDSTSLYVAGKSGSVGAYDFGLAKFDAATGNAAWGVTADNGGANDEAVDVAVDGNGHVFVTGATGLAGSRDFLTLEFDASGVEQDRVTFDLAHSEDVPSAVALGVDGGSKTTVYLAGYSSSDFIGIGGHDNFVTMKYATMQSDLTMTSLGVPSVGIIGETISLSNTLENIRDPSAGKFARAENFDVVFYLSPDGAFTPANLIPLGTRNITLMESGDVFSTPAVFTVPSLPLGDYFLMAVADDGDVVGEKDETNNDIKITSSTITLMRSVDLTPSVVRIPVAATAGNQISVDYAVTNLGNDTSAASDLEFILSTDKNLGDPADVSLGTVAVGALGGGSTLTSSTNLTIPGSTTDGSYYVIAIVDPQELQDELNEGNNSRVSVQTTTAVDSGDSSDGAITLSGTFDLSSGSSDALGNADDDNPGQPDGYSSLLTADAASGATSLTVGSTAGYVSGDELLIIQVVHDTNHGVYEFVKNITVDNATTLSFAIGLTHDYFSSGTTAQGTANTVQVVRIPQYSTLTIPTGMILTTSAFDGATGIGGILAFRAVTLTVDGTIDTSAKGYPGGSGKLNAEDQGYGCCGSSFMGDAGWSYTGQGDVGILSGQSTVAPTAVNAGGGGGGGRNFTVYGGGGGAGYAASGTGGSPSGFGGSVYGDAGLSGLYMGSGGGSGAINYSSGATSGKGGNGGGIIMIVADIMVGNGSISAAGQNGSKASKVLGATNNTAGGGGGGSGGSIYLDAVTPALTDVTVPGGSGGGALGSNGQVGGDGSEGRINIPDPTATIAITGGVPPDYTITAVSGPLGAVQLEQVMVSATLENIGGDHTGSVTVGFYLSSDQTITSGNGDFFIGSQTLSGLANGASSNINATVTIPQHVAEGGYYLGAIADYNAIVTETNEANNSLAASGSTTIGITFDGGDSTDGDVTVAGTFNLLTDSSDALGNAGDDNGSQPDGFATLMTIDTLQGSATMKVGSTAGFVTGDEVLVIQTIHDTNHGYYEFIKNVTVTDATTLTLASGLSNTYYATGSTVKGTTNTVQVVRVPNYTSLDVPLGTTLTTSAFDATGTRLGGILALRATALTVDGNIEANAKGYPGGPAKSGGIGGCCSTSSMGDAGWSYRGVGNVGVVSGQSIVTPTVANNGGGGGGGRNFNTWGGGGGAGYKVAGSGSSPDGFAGSSYGDASLSKLYFGSGGGSGATSYQGVLSGEGGIGGGIIYVAAGTAAVTGVVTTNGENGLNGIASGSDEVGGGGGGSGGSLYLLADPCTGCTVDVNITATGGAGGTGHSTGNNGHVGSVGRIYLPTPSLADLVISDVTGPTNAARGDVISVSTTVNNVMALAAGAFKVGIYISPDSTITTGDTFLGDRLVAGLTGNNSDTASTNVTIPLDLFDTYIGLNYRKAITIDAGQVSGSGTLVNFPVLVSVTDPDLRTVANGGRVEDANGYDIIFRDAGGVDDLDFEVEEYNAATGLFRAWVRIPSLSGTINTIIYLYYGSTAITTSKENPTRVWDNDYRAILHEDETPGVSNQLDSTSNGLTLSNANMSAGNLVNGKVGKAINFNGTTNYQQSSAAVLNQGTTDWTIDLWVDTDINGAQQNFVQSMDAGSTGRSLVYNTSGNVVASYLGGSQQSSGYTLTAASGWNHIALVHDNVSNTLTWYINGAFITTNTGVAGENNSAIWRFGRDKGSTSVLNGQLDEVRISKSQRSADWIITGYNNQNSPATFYSVGSEETVTGQQTFYLGAIADYYDMNAVPADISWTSVTGLSAVGNSLTKGSGSNAWDAGAISNEVITGDGYIEFTASETNTHRMFGLNSSNTTVSWTDIDYAIFLTNSGSVQIREEGSNNLCSCGTYAVNDVFRIERTGGGVEYKQNGTTIYTSINSSSGTVFADVSINTVGGTITNAKTITYNSYNAIQELSESNNTQVQAGSGSPQGTAVSVLFSTSSSGGGGGGTMGLFELLIGACVWSLMGLVRRSRYGSICKMASSNT